MKQVGIITLHIADNYGAVLQAYALKRTLNLLYPDVQINMINYFPSRWDEEEHVKFSKNLKENIIAFERLCFFAKERDRWNSLKRFCKQNDNLTELCTSKTDLEKVVRDYDCVITGSDQIWNLNLTRGDDNYFLNFDCGTAKKVAYASSMGGYRFSDRSAGFVEYLKQFDSLSCRETSAAEYIAHITGSRCKSVCDPTLLLSPGEYLHLLEGNVGNRVKNLSEKKYLLIYALRYHSEIVRKSKELAEKYNLKVYAIFPNLRYACVASHSFIDASVEDFLHLFSKAEFIVTDSFHGTCFSLINQKNFVTIRRGEAGNERITDMLKELGLLDRLWIEGENDTCVLDVPIDYEKVNEHILLKRLESMEYLRNAIQIGEP